MNPKVKLFQTQDPDKYTRIAFYDNDTYSIGIKHFTGWSVVRGKVFVVSPFSASGAYKQANSAVQLAYNAYRDTKEMV